MPEKNVNYTDEMTTDIVEAYNDAETDAERETVVQELAEKHGRTVRSIRAKLVREGVYIAKTYKNKNGKKPETKEDIVTAIAKVMNVTVDALNGLEKATKPTLNLLRERVRTVAESEENE